MLYIISCLKYYTFIIMPYCIILPDQIMFVELIVFYRVKIRLQYQLFYGLKVYMSLYDEYLFVKQFY